MPTSCFMDHNLDLLKSDKHKHIAQHGLQMTINKPTRITHTSATLIDDILIDNKLTTSYKSRLLLDDMSDHLPCLISMENVKPDKNGKAWVLKRKFNPKSIDKINSDLREENWPNTLADLNC